MTKKKKERKKSRAFYSSERNDSLEQQKNVRVDKDPMSPPLGFEVKADTTWPCIMATLAVGGASFYEMLLFYRFDPVKNISVRDIVSATQSGGD